MSKKPEDDGVDLMLKLTKELDNESDRSMAVLAGGYLDYLLGKLIATVMAVDYNKVDKLLYDEGHGPLGAFGSRIDMAYCMGLINEDEHKDLDLIRRIRNDFAHKLTGMSFDTPSIASRCEHLIGAKEGKRPSTGRERFKKASIRLMVDITLEIKGKRNQCG